MTLSNEHSSTEIPSTEKASTQHWADTVNADTKGITKAGLLTVGGFFIVFGLWAVLFPLSSAVIAVGSVIPIGKSKTIQHPTGGTVTSIQAIDGQVVKKGDLIITLDPVVDQAELSSLQSRYALLQAMEARLLAQYHGQSDINFPEAFRIDTKQEGIPVTSSSKIRYAQLMADQQREFNANRQRLKKELSELDQQINSSGGQLSSLRSQKNNIIKQRQNLSEQLKRAQPLLDKGFYARNDADALERQLLGLSGDLDGVKTEITNLEFRIKEIEERKATIFAGAKAEVLNQLSETRGEMDSVKNQITSVGNALDKRDVRAAADGVVTKSAVNTIGGVVRSGDTIAEIVPAGGYKVEARVAPQDIDYIHSGQTARIVVTAFNRTLNDPIDATVDYVSADSGFDEQTGETFFIVRLILLESPKAMSQINKLRAGMQSEVYINTGERNFISYLMKPLTNGFRRAFQES